MQEFQIKLKEAQQQSYKLRNEKLNLEFEMRQAENKI